jgi:hypothetical protein
MPFKVKALVGLVQCLAAVPSVFDVAAPHGLEGYTRWTQMMDLPADLTSMVISPSCLGSYQSQILIGSCWPIVLILLSAAACVVFELVQERRKRDPARVAPRSTRDVVSAGLQHILPITLVMTFILVPSTATRIFKTFLCVPIQYSDVVTHRCAPSESRTCLSLASFPCSPHRVVVTVGVADLHDDLSLSCDSPEYEATRRTALAMILLWPVGTPLLCTLSELEPWLLDSQPLSPTTGVRIPVRQMLCSCGEAARPSSRAKRRH